MDKVRFGVVGINHGHIYAQVEVLLSAGAECVGFYAPEDALAARFAARYPQIPRVDRAARLLEDESVALITTAAIPNERGPLGVAVMQHGKDFLTDKPAFTTLAQLAEARRVQAETGRIYAIYFGRFENRATLKAGELVRAGAIGQVVHFTGTGPHRISLSSRPDWFFVREKYGGIINDIGAHQFDHFIYFTGSTRAEVLGAQASNQKYPQYPELEEIGEAMLRGDRGSGYIRVDWYGPDDLPTWGDKRLIIGTEGYIEAGQAIDLAGRTGKDQVLLANRAGAEYVDCSQVELTFGRDLVNDVRRRTQTAFDQKAAFLACELSLRAQAAAKLGPLTGDR